MLITCIQQTLKISFKHRQSREPFFYFVPNNIQYKLQTKQVVSEKNYSSTSVRGR